MQTTTLQVAFKILLRGTKRPYFAYPDHGINFGGSRDKFGGSRDEFWQIKGKKLADHRINLTDHEINFGGSQDKCLVDHGINLADHRINV